MAKSKRPSTPRNVKTASAPPRRSKTNEELEALIVAAVRERRWDAVAHGAGLLHGRSLPIVPYSSPAWREDLRDRLHSVHGRFAMLVDVTRADADHAHLAAVERVLRALDIAFQKGWSAEGADGDFIARLDRIARPYARKHGRHGPIGGGGEHERPAAAEYLRDWWAAQILSAVKFGIDEEVSAHVTKLFAGTVEKGLDSTFVTMRDDLPKDWRSPARLRRVGVAFYDLIERDALDVTKPDVDDLGEKLARRTMVAIGYPVAKAKSLFDTESKRAKAPSKG